MKRAIILLAGLLLVAIVPSAAFAENAGYERGFYIKNDDDTFKLTLGGRVQTKFFWEKDPKRTMAAIGGDPTVSKQYMSFQIRRALMGVRANFHDIVTAGFTMLHVTAPAGSSGAQFAAVQIDAATLAVEVIPEFTVTVGMTGLPLDLIGDMSSAWRLLPEAPITMTQTDGLKNETMERSDFGAPAGLGVNFSGGYWKWYYSASIVNGAESNYAINPNRWFSYGFKTGFNILDPVPGSMTDFECSETPKLTVNAGTVYQGRRRDANTNALVSYLWSSSLGVAVRWAGFSFTTEGYYRKTRVLDPGTFSASTRFPWARPRLTDVGYYAAAGYYAIPKKFEIAAQAGQIFRQGPDNNSYQMGGGLNYYIFDNNLKLQLAYTLTADYDASPTEGPIKVHNIALMAQALF